MPGASRPKPDAPESVGGDEGDGDDRPDGLTDRDLLALFVREPFSGVTPEVYASLSDRQIIAVYLAERDKDGGLIAEGGRRRREQQERLRMAGRELPSPESLHIPPEVLASRTYLRAPHWAVMFFQVWASRGLSPEQTLAKWRAEGHR